MDVTARGAGPNTPPTSDMERSGREPVGADARAQERQGDGQQDRVNVTMAPTRHRRFSTGGDGDGVNNLVIRTPPTPVSPTSASVPSPAPIPARAAEPAVVSPSSPTPPGESIQALTDRLATEIPSIPGFVETKLKQIFKEKFNLAIEPRDVQILSFNYLKGKSETSRGAIYARMPLIEAAISNAQSFPAKDGVPVPWRKQAPRIELRESIPLLPFGAVYPKTDATGESTVAPNAYTGVYTTRGDLRAGQVLEPSSQLPVSPTALSNAIWEADFLSAFQSHLNGFWEKNRNAYTAVSKAAFLKAADQQRASGTLSRQAHDFAWRIAQGGSYKAWSDLTPDELIRRVNPDPRIDTGLLSIRGHDSTDLIYGTNKKTGLSLLYIPGSSSPIHTFKDMDTLKRWFAAETADPLKRETLGRHFSAKDRWDSDTGTGVDSALRGLGEAKDGSAGDVIEARPSTDPFHTTTERVEKRGRDDGQALISTQRDYYKARIRTVIDGLKVMVAPISLLAPPAAVVVGGVAGVGELALDVDDKVQGKRGQPGVASSVLDLIASTGPVLRFDPRIPAPSTSPGGPPAPSATAELTSVPHTPRPRGAHRVRSKLPPEVIATLKTMDDNRHFMGVMNVRTRVIYVFPSALKDSPGSRSRIESPLPTGFTYQAGPDVQRSPHGSEDLIALQRKNYGLSGLAALVDLVNGTPGDFVGFSGVKGPDGTFRLAWSSPTLNPPHSTSRRVTPQEGSDVLDGKLRTAVVKRFERAGFKIAP